MENLEQWLNEWDELRDPMLKKKMLEETSDELKEELVIKGLNAWWHARYFYPEKKQTRVGDRFVWLYLAMRGQGKNKAGQAEFKRVYKTATESPEFKNAIELTEEGLKTELYGAANLYVSTLNEPPKIFGIIPRKDDTPEEKRERIAHLIVDDHYFTIWKTNRDFIYAEALIGQMNKAAEDVHPGIRREIKSVIDKTTDAAFRDWVLAIIL